MIMSVYYELNRQMLEWTMVENVKKHQEKVQSRSV